MKRDAHYYAILAFARACGYRKESAHAIAYASQFVDDAKINLIYLENPCDTIECNQISNHKVFHNIATCHSYFRIKTFNYEAMINNTSAFHFVPGCKGKNFSTKMRCLEESPIILEILKEAYEIDDVVRFGMVLHTYADTFSHQGFSGLVSKVNDIRNCVALTEDPKSIMGIISEYLKYLSQEDFDKYFDRLMPAYGHGQAFEFPDLPYLVWSYEYDSCHNFSGDLRRLVIDNRDRYKRAFKRIKDHLDNFLQRHPSHLDKTVEFSDFNLLYDILIKRGTDKQREENWRKFLIGEGLFDSEEDKYLRYDDSLWLREAFTNYSRKLFNNRTVIGAKLVDNFANTHWYKFVQSVRWYKKLFYKYSSMYGLDIPR